MNHQRLLAASVLAAAALTTSSAQAAVLTVDCTVGPFLTIQAAVFAAVNGDTIVVHPCVYNENVNVAGFDDLHFVAAEAAAPLAGSFSAGVGVFFNSPVIVNGAGLPGSCFTIAGSTSVSVAGFRMQNCSNGVEIQQSFDTVVTSNRIQNMARAGVFQGFGGGTVIASNLFGFNNFGIHIQAGSDDLIVDNRIVLSGADGILLESDRIQVVNNDVSNSGNIGIHSFFGSAHRLERNTTQGSGGPANLQIEAALVLVDAIGNNTAFALVDFAFSDLAENL